MKIKLIPIKYPNAVSLDMKEKQEIKVREVDETKIKETINKFLFDKKYNYVLVKMPDGLYICEAFDDKPRYNARQIKHHPHEQLFK